VSKMKGQSVQQKLQYIQELEHKIKLKDGLPHLYGFKWYPWALDFFNAIEKDAFLTAANQVSKSSTQIRRVIHWATEPKIWKYLFPTRRPYQFWYCMPSRDIIDIEVLKKWEMEFLPRGEFKEHEQYGWKIEKRQGHIFAIHFNTQVSIYFKTYMQDPTTLQAGTADYIAFDEELPMNLFDELSFRRAATDGYLSGVFTPTLSQKFWHDVMEKRGPGEKMVHAFKRQVSMYDCQKYTDGTDSIWTNERIQRVINSCQNDDEVQRRVFGRFIMSKSSLKYASFDRDYNYKKPTGPPPADWHLYAGVDVGGGGNGHPGAISFIAVRPDFRYGRVFKHWRGKGELTTAGDILTKFKEMKGNLNFTMQCYDWHAKDFHTLASRSGESFTPADKSHDTGEQHLNTLFKNGALAIDDIEECQPIGDEFENLRRDTPKNKAVDDSIDSVRYCATRIPWDWPGIAGETKAERVVKQTEDGLTERERNFKRNKHEDSEGAEFLIEDEIESWNELMDV